MRSDGRLRGERNASGGFITIDDLGLGDWAIAPILIGIKPNGIPMMFKTIHGRNLARYSSKLTHRMRRERICRIEHKVSCVVRDACESGCLPLHMFEFSVCRRLRQNLGFETPRPKQPAKGTAERIP